VSRKRLRALSARVSSRSKKRFVSRPERLTSAVSRSCRREALSRTRRSKAMAALSISSRRFMRPWVRLRHIRIHSLVTLCRRWCSKVSASSINRVSDSRNGSGTYCCCWGCCDCRRRRWCGESYGSLGIGAFTPGIWMEERSRLAVRSVNSLSSAS
jgi:hypothetical protein